MSQTRVVDGVDRWKKDAYGLHAQLLPGNNEAWWKRTFRDGEVLLAGVNEDDRLVGYLLGELAPHAVVHELATVPDSQRTGVATRLLHRLASIAQTQGHGAMFVHPFADDSNAIDRLEAFYRTRGFEPGGPQGHWTANPTDVLHRTADRR